jgi:hypothetical protein
MGHLMSMDLQMPRWHGQWNQHCQKPARLCPKTIWLIYPLLFFKIQVNVVVLRPHQSQGAKRLRPFLIS